MTDREYMAIGRATMRAAAELPEGWGLEIRLERNAGTVYFTDPDGYEMSLDNDAELFSGRINAAINQAIADAVEREDDDD